MFRYKRWCGQLCYKKSKSMKPGRDLLRYMKYWSIVLCIFCLVSLLLSSPFLLFSYAIFSAARFLETRAFLWVHLTFAFSTIASTPSRYLCLDLAVIRSISSCLPFSRSSTLKCTLRSCAVSFSFRSLCSSLGSVVSALPLLVACLHSLAPATLRW